MMHQDDAIFAMAGSVVERARELIDDGWVKGKIHVSAGRAPVAFCIEGALSLAAEEMFSRVHRHSSTEILEIARAFILDEIQSQMNRTYSSIPGFNDESTRDQQQILSVLDGASRRLWNLSVDHEDLGYVDLSRFTNEEPTEEVHQYLYATLAN